LQLGIPQTTVWRVVHNRLHLHAYKVQILQALKPDDKPRRFQFAEVLILKVLKLFELHFHIPKQFYFLVSGLKI
jgi:hypothetical protein